MNESLSDNEKAFLVMLLQIGKIIVETAGGYYDLSAGSTFDRNDLFNLACKLQIENQI